MSKRSWGWKRLLSFDIFICCSRKTHGILIFVYVGIIWMIFKLINLISNYQMSCFLLWIRFWYFKVEVIMSMNFILKWKMDCNSQQQSLVDLSRNEIPSGKAVSLTDPWVFIPKKTLRLIFIFHLTAMFHLLIPFPFLISSILILYFSSVQWLPSIQVHPFLNVPV